MRLWHEALIPYLPRQQLLGQHRECCALRGLGWGKPHSVVNYVFQHPFGFLVAYHWRILDEMEKRGYIHDPAWDDAWYHGKNSEPASKDEFVETLGYLFEFKEHIYPEHDAAYLQECLDNLAGKGIHIDMK